MKGLIAVLFLTAFIVGCGSDIPTVDLKKMMDACEGNGGSVSIRMDTRLDPEFQIKHVNCVDGAMFKHKTVL
jgi:hypothetical protein